MESSECERDKQGCDENKYKAHHNQHGVMETDNAIGSRNTRQGVNTDDPTHLPDLTEPTATCGKPGLGKPSRVEPEKDMSSEDNNDQHQGQQLIMAVKAGDLKSIDAVLQLKQEGRGNGLSQDALNAALLEACTQGRKFVIQKLVRFGADVNVRMPDKTSATPLHIAARQGFVDIVDFLLSKGGADVNAVDGEGNTALLLAVNPAGSSDMLNLLVGHGAECDVQNSNGMTALMKAVEVVDIDGMGVLMYAQSGVDKRNKDGLTARDIALKRLIGNAVRGLIYIQPLGDKTNKDGQTARDIAVNIGISDVFDILMEEALNHQKRSESFKSKALTSAVLKSHPETVKVLLDCRALKIETTDTQKRKEEDDNGAVFDILNELITSISRDTEEKKGLDARKLEIAQALIASGIDAERSCRYPYGSYTLHKALVSATRCGAYELVRLMCGIKNINVNEESDPSALMVAAEIGRVDFVKLLLSFGADPSLEQNKYNKDTALTYALMAGHVECAQILFQKDKPSEEKLKAIARKAAQKGRVNSLEFLASRMNFHKISQSLLEPGVLSGDTKMVSFLIDHGADINSSLGRNRPALLVALHKSEYRHDNFLEMAKFLLKSGAQVNKTASFDSPLITAMDHRSGLDVLRCLLAHGADVNEVGNSRHDTPLNFALSEYTSGLCKTRSEIIEVLLAAQADVNKPNRNGTTPLHLAVRCSHPGIVKQLIEAGADLERRDSHGFTPILLAAFLSETEVISVLKKCGADVKALGSDGKNALMWGLKNYRCKMETLSLLSDEKDQVNIQTPDGLTPLILAARDSNYKAIALLLEAGADPHRCNHKQETALSILLNTLNLREEALPSVKLLIRHGALRSLHKAYCCPLYNKIMSGDRELVQLMVTHGMAPMCLDLKKIRTSSSLNGIGDSILCNCSPLVAALVRDRVAIARYLLENWFLTPCDVSGSTQIREIRASLENDQQSATLTFLDDHFSQPMRLAQLSFVAVSGQLGEMIRREERVRQLPLPTIMQDKLLFKKELCPMDFEVQSDSNPSQRNILLDRTNLFWSRMAILSQIVDKNYFLQVDFDDEYPTCVDSDDCDYDYGW